MTRSLFADVKALSPPAMSIVLALTIMELPVLRLNGADKSLSIVIVQAKPLESCPQEFSEYLSIYPA